MSGGINPGRRIHMGVPETIIAVGSAILSGLASITPSFIKCCFGASRAFREEQQARRIEAQISEGQSPASPADKNEQSPLQQQGSFHEESYTFVRHTSPTGRAQMWEAGNEHHERGRGTFVEREEQRRSPALSPQVLMDQVVNIRSF